MPFPELGRILKRFWPDSSLTTLNLKSQALNFDPVTVAWYAQNGYTQLYSMLGGGAPAWSGESVSIEKALNHSVVFACNRIVSEPIGYIPATLMRVRGDDKVIADNLPMYSAMKHAPNDEITAQGFRETLTSHCLLSGNGYAQIVRRSGTGTAIALRELHPECVLPDREKQGQKRLVYSVKEDNSPDRTYTVQQGKPHDILHLRGLGWDGVRGYSVITVGRQSIGTAIAAERNVGRFWANGGRLPYILEMVNRFKDDDHFKKFRKDWQATYADPDNAPILENDIKYKQIGLNMADAQTLESRQFTIPEICRWFSVSPHLVGDLSRATFSNIEHLTLEFVKMTLSTWISRWEQEFWRCVLTPEEKEQGYFLHHNVNALLRGDFKTRMEGYASALQNGHMSINEVRDLEDRNPIDGGEDYHIQLNMQTLPGGEPTTAQTAALIKVGRNGNNA